MHLGKLVGTPRIAFRTTHNTFRLLMTVHSLSLSLSASLFGVYTFRENLLKRFQKVDPKTLTPTEQAFPGRFSKSRKSFTFSSLRVDAPPSHCGKKDQSKQLQTNKIKPWPTYEGLRQSSPSLLWTCVTSSGTNWPFWFVLHESPCKISRPNDPVWGASRRSNPI